MARNISSDVYPLIMFLGALLYQCCLVIVMPDLHPVTAIYIIAVDCAGKYFMIRALHTSSPLGGEPVGVRLRLARGAHC